MQENAFEINCVNEDFNKPDWSSNRMYYYRTGTGVGIDLIIEYYKWIMPIEIKFTQKINRRDLRALKYFITERNCPVGWVVHNCERIEWLDDKILGIPATCLWFIFNLNFKNFEKFLEWQLIEKGEIK